MEFLRGALATSDDEASLQYFADDDKIIEPSAHYYNPYVLNLLHMKMVYLLLLLDRYRAAAYQTRVDFFDSILLTERHNEMVHYEVLDLLRRNDRTPFKMDVYYCNFEFVLHRLTRVFVARDALARMAADFDDNLHLGEIVLLTKLDLEGEHAPALRNLALWMCELYVRHFYFIGATKHDYERRIAARCALLYGLKKGAEESLIVRKNLCRCLDLHFDYDKELALLLLTIYFVREFATLLSEQVLAVSHTSLSARYNFVERDVGRSRALFEDVERVDPSIIASPEDVILFREYLTGVEAALLEEYNRRLYLGIHETPIQAPVPYALQNFFIWPTDEPIVDEEKAPWQRYIENESPLEYLSYSCQSALYMQFGYRLLFEQRILMLHQTCPGSRVACNLCNYFEFGDEPDISHLCKLGVAYNHGKTYAAIQPTRHILDNFLLSLRLSLDAHSARTLLFYKTLYNISILSDAPDQENIFLMIDTRALSRRVISTGRATLVHGMEELVDECIEKVWGSRDNVPPEFDLAPHLKFLLETQLVFLVVAEIQRQRVDLEKYARAHRVDADDVARGPDEVLHSMRCVYVHYFDILCQQIKRA